MLTQGGSLGARSSIGGRLKHIRIPSPRPKRRPVLPYPRKASSPLFNSLPPLEEDRNSAPSAIFYALKSSKKATDLWKTSQEEFKKIDTAAASSRLLGKLVVPVREECESDRMEESSGSLRSGVSTENVRDFSTPPIRSEEFKKTDTAAAGFRLFGKWVDVQVNGSSHVHTISMSTVALSSLPTYRAHAAPHPQTKDIPFAWQDINAWLPALKNDCRNMSITYSPVAAVNKRPLLPGMQGLTVLPGLHAHAHQEQYRVQRSIKASSDGNEFEQAYVCGENSFAECYRRSQFAIAKLQ